MAVLRLNWLSRLVVPADEPEVLFNPVGHIAKTRLPLFPPANVWRSFN